MNHYINTKMFLTVAILICGLAYGPWVNPTQAEVGTGGYAVIVNESSSYSGSRDAMISTVRQLYLKDRGEWPDGAESKPFGAGKGSDTHKAFLATVLSMTESELAQHWISLKQRTGQTAPRAVKSSRMLGKLVSKYDGAFGVMTAEDAESAKGVKVLFKFD